MSQVSATPPMHPGPLGPARPASWPGVIGIICIIVASISILGGIWGLVVPLFMRGIFAAAAQTPGGAAAVAMQSIGQVNSAIMLVLAFVLLAGGIALNGRRRVGARLLLTWSILRVILAVAISIPMAQAMSAQAAAVAAQSRGAPAGMVSGFMFVGVAVGLVWSCSLPTFLLIWLSLASSRRHIGEWS